MIDKNRDQHCLVDGAATAFVDGVLLPELEPTLRRAIQQDFPEHQAEGFICLAHLLPYRLARINAMRLADQQINRQM